jgi:hypothetical protein
MAWLQSVTRLCERPGDDEEQYSDQRVKEVKHGIREDREAFLRFCL